jgi:putative restriction endonuclease
MARLSKSDLLQRVEEGFRSGGWNVLYLSPAGEHPARYRVYKDDRSLIVRVYIWNVTHGGGAARAAAEYRIQITGLEDNHFEPEIGGKTLILGWWANDEIFAGFDYRRHAGPLGGSPSFQIGLAALRSAVANRFATHAKGNGELAIAFRSDFLGTYAENLEALHDTGAVPAEVELLTRIAAEPDETADEEIAEEVAAPRRWAVTQTRRALRALDFGERVLSAYRFRCAMCGIQLELLDGAHILPVADPDSTDETSNGVALCTLHHRAYDRSLVTFDPEYRIHLNQERIRELRDAGLDGKLRAFRDALRAVIHLPAERGNRPRGEFVERANDLRGWNFWS